MAALIDDSSVSVCAVYDNGQCLDSSDQTKFTLTCHSGMDWRTAKAGGRSEQQSWPVGHGADAACNPVARDGRESPRNIGEYSQTGIHAAWIPAVHTGMMDGSLQSWRTCRLLARTTEEATWRNRTGQLFRIPTRPSTTPATSSSRPGRSCTRATRSPFPTKNMSRNYSRPTPSLVETRASSLWRCRTPGAHFTAAIFTLPTIPVSS